MPKFTVTSLGCAKNLVDTEIMLGQLVKEGWELTPNIPEAELILVNTCGFVADAKRESIGEILKMAEYKKKGIGSCAKLVVAGCLAQRYTKELSAKIPEVDYWIGLGEIGEILRILREPNKRQIETRLPFLNDANLPRYQVTLSHTAYLKIAEGCDHGCSYCAIPLIKGGFHSRSMNSVLAEAKALVKSGAKEINLIAQDITMYGQDLPERLNLTDLLKEIILRAAPDWIRLLYAYPSGISEDLLDLIIREPRICKYLDLPLQHIGREILRRMNRPDAPELIKEKLRLIRKTAPGITLRTTFMVGFPGETDADFQELLKFISETRFEHLGVFTYSREEGTPAYGLKPQLKEKTKERRKSIILAEQQRISAAFLKDLRDTEQNILVDKLLPDGGAIGRTEAFAPEVDGAVYLRGYHGASGRFVRGRISGSDSYNLEAEVVDR